MTAKISTLGESLSAPWTLERSLTCMLPKVVTEVAALLKDAVAAFELTFEV